MSKISNGLMRGISGLFIANSGAGKIGMPAEASAGVQQYAATGVPMVNQLPAEKFGSILGWSEVGLGTALVLPLVPDKVAGAGLTVFSGGLLSLYFADPENRKDDGIRPSDQGLSLSKDVFMLAIGLGLLFDNSRSKKKAQEK